MSIVLHQILRQSVFQDRMLFVGPQHDASPWVKLKQRSLLPFGCVMAVQFGALDRDTLVQINPQLVIFALFSQGPIDRTADSLAIVERLQLLNYQGQIAVIAPQLPRPDLVQAELRALGPGARLTLFATST